MYSQVWEPQIQTSKEVQKQKVISWQGKGLGLSEGTQQEHGYTQKPHL